jgi:RimJ/RimL family protein N-acetyltransferase
VSDPLERPIETDRLVLRPMRPDDAEELFEILRAPEIGVAMREPPAADVADVRVRIESWIRGPGADRNERWLNWLGRTRDDRAVAHLSATIRGRSAWLAWIVAVERQRRGYATEAACRIMDHLARNGIPTFLASIRPGHEASEGVARNLAMLPTNELAGDERVWRSTGVAEVVGRRRLERRI